MSDLITAGADRWLAYHERMLRKGQVTGLAEGDVGTRRILYRAVFCRRQISIFDILAVVFSLGVKQGNLLAEHSFFLRLRLEDVKCDEAL